MFINKPVCLALILLPLFWACGGSSGRVITGGIAKGVGETIGKTGTDALVNYFKDQSITKEEALQKAAIQINRSTPFQVDQDTLLLNTYATGDTFIYNYELINYSSDQVDADEFANLLYPVVRNSLCSKPEMQLALQNGVSFQYSYSGNDKMFISKFTVSPADCNS